MGELPKHLVLKLLYIQSMNNDQLLTTTLSRVERIKALEKHVREHMKIAQAHVDADDLELAMMYTASAECGYRLLAIMQRNDALGLRGGL